MDIKLADLAAAEAGSYYTILGTGGDLAEWIEGYEKLLAKSEIGKPTEWFQTTGAAINEYTKPSRRDDFFHPDLAVLMFPLDGLNVGRLALFRIEQLDRWFDDIVRNIKHS